MFKQVFLVVLFIALAACGTTQNNASSAFSSEMTSNDPEYGYTAQKPIELGGFLRGSKYEGAHIDYFQSLEGPNGETVEVKRLGSCCAFEDATMPFGGGMLDRYQLSYNGIKKPVVIYVNLYKFNKPLAPKGFLLL